MGDVGVKGGARAHLLLLVGASLIVASVFLLLGVAFALLVAGVLTVAYALLLVDVPDASAVAPGPGDLTRVGR